MNKSLLLLALSSYVLLASAHVTIFPNTAAVGQRTYVYAQIPHSCDGAPNSIGVSVRIPTNLTAQPMQKEGFTLTRTTRLKSNGASQTDWVTWMANSASSPFPDWQLGLFGISVTFPAAYFSVGRKVWFQTIQYCDGNDTQAYSNWTLVVNPTAEDDVDLQLAALGETAPSITVTAATVLTTYINTTSYGVIDNSDEWTTDSTISIIALLLAVISCIGWVYVFCNMKPKGGAAAAGAGVAQKKAVATPGTAASAAPTPTPTPAPAAGTTFVAANVA